jgi:uncharacterized Zn finger protein
MTLSEDERWAIRVVAGKCPHHDCWPPNGAGGGQIFRSSHRSVTMRCPDCGLLWTVTVHQMVKAARRILAKRNESVWHSYEEFCELTEQDVRVLERWAASVPERRGRRKGPG